MPGMKMLLRWKQKEKHTHTHTKTKTKKTLPFDVQVNQKGVVWKFFQVFLGIQVKLHFSYNSLDFVFDFIFFFFFFFTI